MSVKVFARNSRAGNGCANFMVTWDLRFFLQETSGNGCANFMVTWDLRFFLQETSMLIKFLVLGGYLFFFFWGGGGSANYIFMGGAIFLRIAHLKNGKNVKDERQTPFGEVS